MKKIAIDIIAMQKKIQRGMNEERYLHTMGVTYTATALAMVHGCDLRQAQIAGLLHDCAKARSGGSLLRMCQKNGVKMSSYEQTHPHMLHAKAGALVARGKYMITNSEILDAIRFHTTGKPAMSELGKIIYIADFIEPNRKELNCLKEIRKVAFEDSDECVYLILKNILEWLESNNEAIDDASKAAYEYYENIHNQKGE